MPTAALGELLVRWQHMPTSRHSTFNPRPAGPSPTPALCWGGGGAGGVAPPSISVTNRHGGNIKPAMESPGRDRSDKVEKFDYGITCDVTSQVKHKMFYISI